MAFQIFKKYQYQRDIKRGGRKNCGDIDEKNKLRDKR